MRDAVVLGEAGDLRVEGEAEDREQVDVLGVDRLARRLLHVRRADGAVLRADRDRDPRSARRRPPRRRAAPIAWMYSPA